MTTVTQTVQTEKRYKWDIYWPNVIALAVLHAAAVYGLFLKTESKTATEVFEKVVGVLSAWGITAGAHRLWSHRSYKATTLGQIIIMFLASMTYQNSIYTWVRDHRMHHRFGETDADPHNAKRGFFFSHMGWLMVRKHDDVKANKDSINMGDLEANPVVMFQHRYYYPVVLFCCIFVTTFVPWYFWGESLKVSFFRATICRYIISVHMTWCINSVAHMFGYKPYDKNIGAGEYALMKYSSFGEGFHNYHHAYPWDYKDSEFGNGTQNSTAMFIDCMAWLGLVHGRKSQLREISNARMKRTGDGSFSENQTIFRRYIPKTVDKVIKNVWNLLVTLSILYLL